MTEEQMKQTEALQNEMHRFIEQLKERDRKLTYDVCQTIFMLNKLAELQIKTNRLASVQASVARDGEGSNAAQ